MKKKLSDRTLEELWQLFPILLTAHQACWKDWFKEEARLIESILPEEWNVRISHIGSMAIPGIWAKPIIDILVETADEQRMQEAARLLSENGYICMNRQQQRISLNKGYTEDGFAEQVFHLHLRLTGNRDEVLFRDYLIAHPQEAAEYERLKLDLWKRYEHDRDGYTQAKTEFVQRVMRCVRETGTKEQE